MLKNNQINGTQCQLTPIELKLQKFFGEEIFANVLSKCVYKISMGNFVVTCKNSEITREININLLDGLKAFCSQNWPHYKVDVVLNIDINTNLTINAHGNQEFSVSNQNNTIQQTKNENIIYSDFSKQSQNNHYTFETFIEDKSNIIALTASQLFINYKPSEEEDVRNHNLDNIKLLFLTGEVGRGKTHLAKAILHEALKNGANIGFFPAETFVSNYVHSVRNNKLFDFKHSISSLDILILDDVHTLITKKATLEELTRQVSCLLDSGKKVLLTSAISEQNFAINKNLHSRISSGFIANIDKPTESLKTKIVSRIVMSKNLPISIDVIKFLAQNVNGEIRELKGAINRLAMLSSIYQTSLGIGVVKEILRDALINGQNRKERTIVNCRFVANLLENFFELNIGELTSKGRGREAAFVRNIAIYLCKILLRESYATIGKEFGGRTHVAVVHSIAKVESGIENNDKNVIKAISFVRDQLMQYSNVKN